MSYNGFEIDMLSLGDADSILITKWVNGSAERVLVDGGYASSTIYVREFLRARGVNHIDHVVCSHLHEDHSGGLVDLVKDRTLQFSKAWMHMPWEYEDLSEIHELAGTTSFKRAQTVEKSLRSVEQLYSELQNRGIDIEEPFEGDKIAFLTVCGPSQSYYSELVGQFTSLYKVKESSQAIELSMQELAEKEAIFKSSSRTLLENPVTPPENNSSVILGTLYEGEKYLFTADAGVEALRAARSKYDLSGCRWMQIPHHGSWRNVNVESIEYFSPSIAFVSAEGNKKHPRRAVVNAFKNVDAVVYSTHYPGSGGNKWEYVGNVPQRPEYSFAIPLYEAS